MPAPDDGGWTTLGLDDEGLAALKNTIMTASLYSDELLCGTGDQPGAGHRMHEDIELLCELLGTSLEELWAEFEQTRSQQFVEYARASSQRAKR